MIRSNRVGILSLVLVALFLVSLGLVATAAEDPKMGGTLTLGVKRPIPNLAYYKAYDASNNLTAMAIWDTVLEYDSDGELAPCLAKSWDVPDENTIILHLREGVEFHDGNTMHADDVIASINFVSASEAQSPMAWMFGSITDLKAVDPMTVEITSTNVPEVLYALATGAGGVSSVEAIEKYGAKIGENPVGAGPFKLENWERGSRVVLTKFENYWQEGKPYLDKIVYQIITEEFSRLTALQTGDLDLVYTLSFENLTRAQAMEGVQVNAFPTFVVYYVALDTRTPPFDDARVRKALNYAVDREALVKSILKGYGAPAITDIAPHMPGSLEGIEPAYPYNPEKAKELLEEAGYEDGFTFEMLVGTVAPDMDTGLVLKQYLSEIGVNLKLVAQEPSNLWNHLQAGDFPEAAMSFWFPDFPDAAGTLRPFNYSENSPPQACCNFSYYSNQEVDSLLNEVSGETDMEKRVELFKEINKIIYEDAPRLWLYNTQKAIPGYDYVEGLEFGPMFFFQHVMTDIWLDR